MASEDIKKKEPEEQKQGEIEAKEKNFEPVDAIKEACTEIGMDYTSPDFSEKEMITRFQDVVDDKNVHF